MTVNASPRRVGAIVAAVLVIGLLTGAAQTAEALKLNIDVGAFVMKVVNVIATGLLALLVAAARRIAKAVDAFKTEVRDKFTTLDSSLSGLTVEMQTVKQELFGVNGTNGMRGQLKDTSDTVDDHDKILIRLSERAGMAIREGSRR